MWQSSWFFSCYEARWFIHFPTVAPHVVKGDSRDPSQILRYSSMGIAWVPLTIFGDLPSPQGGPSWNSTWTNFSVLAKSRNQVQVGRPSCSQCSRVCNKSLVALALKQSGKTSQVCGLETSFETNPWVFSKKEMVVEMVCRAAELDDGSA